MAIVCTLSVIGIIFYHLIIQYTHNHQPITKANQKTIKGKILNHILHCCIISAALYNIVTLCGYFGINTSFGTIHASCYTLRTLYTIFYVTNKTCIYYSYFLRLDVSFGGSSFEVNRCLLIILYIATTIYFLVYIITVIPFDDKTDYEWNYEYNICREKDANFDSVIGLILTLAGILYECIISITTLILFLKPLCYLSHVQNDKNVHHLIIKVAILNGIIIISCITSLVWYSFISSTIIFMIDNVLNSLCLILMVNIHDKLYIKLCYLCISCKWCKFNDNVKNMSELSGTGVSSISL